ncbi:hypothetical protein JTB14_005367 [Gonioctena quinquepunctata]|nr:hypothetical protein JTB14_005367 [Gonioctena quinquepunctata]
MQHSRHERNFVLARDFNAMSTLWNAGLTEMQEDTIEDHEQFNSVVKNAQQLGIDEDIKGRDINQPIWRNEEISTFLADCNRSRRRLIRARSRQAQPESKEQQEIE